MTRIVGKSGLEFLRLFEAQQEQAVESLLERNFSAYIFFHPRRLRLMCFRAVMDIMPDREYWELLAEVWSDTEFPGVNRKTWLELFTSGRKDRNHLMNFADRAAFKQLPDRVQIFRGAKPKYARGMSWTTDLDQAIWFAHRFGYAGNSTDVFAAVIPKEKFLGYFCGRNESEAVIDPRRIKYAALNPTQAQVVEALARREQAKAERTEMTASK